ncbi:hypothetical protein [uncultured Dokdonia sp.]|uniref:hypothetical protein n=1 Tax=uncultured Dokdonia sp. TaxID=575653 RepID=UPI0026251B9E|nr:hypothetical protein [uncultured Dokdonia sp.]
MNLKKIVIVLLFACFIFSNSYAQSLKKKSVAHRIEVSKEALTNFVIKGNGNAKTTNFKVKFPGYPTVVVQGNMLNEKALAHLKASKKGTYIQVFDIKDATSEEKGAKKNPPLIFKLTTNP